MNGRYAYVEQSKKAPPPPWERFTVLSSETYALYQLISDKQHQDSPTANIQSIVDLKKNPDKSVVLNNTVSANRTMGSVNAEEI